MSYIYMRENLQENPIFGYIWWKKTWFPIDVPFNQAIDSPHTTVGSSHPKTRRLPCVGSQAMHLRGHLSRGRDKTMTSGALSHEKWA